MAFCTWSQAVTVLVRPIHWKRWCRRDLHLWQVPKGFSLQRAVCNSDSTCWKTATCSPSSTGPKQLVWKKDGQRAQASLLPAGLWSTASCWLLTPAVKTLHGFQQEDNFRCCKFTAAVSWEEGQRRDPAVHPAVFHRGYSQRQNCHTLGNWSIWSEMKSVHLIRTKMKLFWNQVWEMWCLSKLLC